MAASRLKTWRESWHYSSSPKSMWGRISFLLGDSSLYHKTFNQLDAAHTALLKIYLNALFCLLFQTFFLMASNSQRSTCVCFPRLGLKNLNVNYSSTNYTSLTCSRPWFNPAPKNLKLKNVLKANANVMLLSFSSLMILSVFCPFLSPNGPYPLICRPFCEQKTFRNFYLTTTQIILTFQCLRI